MASSFSRTRPGQGGAAALPVARLSRPTIRATLAFALIKRPARTITRKRRGMTRIVAGSSVSGSPRVDRERAGTDLDHAGAVERDRPDLDMGSPEHPREIEQEVILRLADRDHIELAVVDPGVGATSMPPP